MRNILKLLEDLIRSSFSAREPLEYPTKNVVNNVFKSLKKTIILQNKLYFCSQTFASLRLFRYTIIIGSVGYTATQSFEIQVVITCSKREQLRDYHDANGYNLFIWFVRFSFEYLDKILEGPTYFWCFSQKSWEHFVRSSTGFHAKFFFLRLRVRIKTFTINSSICTN